MQVMLRPFRLLGISGPDCGSLIRPRPTDNADHQVINHFQFPSFSLEEHVSYIFPTGETSCVGNVLGFSGDLWAQGPSCCFQHSARATGAL